MAKLELLDLADQSIQLTEVWRENANARGIRFIKNAEGPDEYEKLTP